MFETTVGPVEKLGCTLADDIYSMVSRESRELCFHMAGYSSVVNHIYQYKQLG